MQIFILIRRMFSSQSYSASARRLFAFVIASKFALAWLAAIKTIN